jgi:hypothetical protein
MAKFQYFFNEGRADVGVEIVPAYTLKRQMSSGVSYGEQLVYDIERLRRHFPGSCKHFDTVLPVKPPPEGTGLRSTPLASPSSA